MSPIAPIISSSSSPFVIDESVSHMMFQPLIATSTTTTTTTTKTFTNNVDSNDDSQLIREDSIGPYDILCGRNKLALNHIGNRRFRITINMNLQTYQTSKSRIEKSVLIANVVQFLQEEAGARFLKPMSGGSKNNKGCYMELNEKQAREKVGHAFRDASSTSSRRKESSSKSKSNSNSNNKKQSIKSKSKSKSRITSTTPPPPSLTTPSSIPDVPPPRTISPMPRVVSDTYPATTTTSSTTTAYETTTTAEVLESSSTKKECCYDNNNNATTATTTTTTTTVIKDIDNDEEEFDFEPFLLSLYHEMI